MRCPSPAIPSSATRMESRTGGSVVPTPWKISLKGIDQIDPAGPTMSNWIRPRYTLDEINAAGEALRLRRPPGEPEPYHVVQNWRMAHWFPLNTVAVSLRKHSARIDPSSTVATRVKRFWSIRKKLQRMRRLTLYEMQDLGGARSIVGSCGAIDRLRRVYNPSAMKRSRYLSEIVGTDDYLEAPKPDGYRGVHLILRYTGRKPDWDGLLTEIQLRTSEQHAWATTVEILETILEQRLRTTQGDATWKRFLALMSSAIALTEGRPRVPATPETLAEIRAQILDLDTSIHVKGTPRGVINAISKAPRFGTGTTWTVLDMRPKADETSVFAFPRDDLADAARKLAEVEEAISTDFASDPGANAVLVSVSSIEKLRDAYPNYYLDATAFIELYDRLILARTGQRRADHDASPHASPAQSTAPNPQ